jgi:hypothetical protein
MIRLKRGDTLILTVYLDEDGSPLVLDLLADPIPIRSQIKTYGGAVVASFVITDGAEDGYYVLTVANTTAFPIGKLFYDIELTIDSVVKSTSTQEITVVKDVTI